jgi:DNA polymerase/3'-5' exonuclease PolX
MSDSVFSFTLDQARQIADRYLFELSPLCARIEVAGSVRRCKDAVNDIELVAIPHFVTQKDMFGDEIGKTSLLDAEATRLAASWGAVLKQNGPKKKKFGLMEGIDLELYLVTPPAHWGVIFAIRTGSSHFSNQLVTRKNSFTHEGRPGLLPSWAQVQDGQVRHRETGEVYPIPEEIDFFKFCGMDYVPPQERK